MKVIIINTCSECPYMHHDPGIGYYPFIRCDKFRIVLLNWYGDEEFNYNKEIHPDCKLADY